MTRVLRNPLAGPVPAAAPDRRPLSFHRTLPGYAPTPLREAPTAARRLGVAEVLVKDESSRLGLPAFKILGASWATYRALTDPVPDAPGLDELRARLGHANAPRLVAATEGNHGRAVARVAAWLSLPACIYVPTGTAAARQAAIAAEGADVVEVDGGYEAAVERAAAAQGDGSLLISDTGWPGYERIPTWIVEGYSTMFQEIDDAPVPDVVAVQIGVGSLAASVIAHHRAHARHTTIVGVEPMDAACVLASLEQGHPIELEGPQRSIMAGLNTVRPSSPAWPTVSRGLDVAVAVEDAQAEEAMRVLAEDGIEAGETGAAGLAGLMAAGRDALGAAPDATVLVIVTEGPTDPDAYRRIVRT